MAMLCLKFASAQEIIKPLKVGDQIPKYLMTLKLLRVNRLGDLETINLSENTKKLVIIDFWASWCGPCLQSLAKLDALRKDFKEHLIIIPSTYEDSDIASKSLNSHEIDLFSISGANNGILKKYFPHRFVPHQVWIKDGIVKAITSGSETTKINIASAIYDNQFVKHVKSDIVEFDRTAPLMTYANQKGIPVKFNIVTTGYIEGLGSNTIQVHNNGFVMSSYYNQPILTIYKKVMNVDFNRIIPNMKDSEKYTDRTLSKEQRYFNLQVTTEDNGKLKTDAKILLALNMAFGLSTNQKKKLAPCFVIRRINEFPKSSFPTKIDTVSLLNMDGLLSALNYSSSWRPNQLIFINESDYSGKISWKTQDFNISQIEELKNQLFSVGLKLNKEYRELDFYEIMDNK